MRMKIIKMIGMELTINSGDQLNEGIYYYFINPESKKFNYKDINISTNGIIGQVQIIRD